ncbi:GMC family oxidoreductase [Paracoccus denitrificans]|jgi:choline dehydrogenase|uniref:Glucose-methanol-choline oxidoreductase n=1 Tax=Paracoccus denitrificans (strain Pd 1222) TaxID=318586 RepID=A1AYF3_PARDP|nr:GMC family oxidoreductase N-terminal domain-containing protein [Paracoccus denitrificans]ABL68297.1 glucose-methanol-choline oxidoreductase [Paracoccus denitrificans PD1222]MBB4627811.1 choline dehydrogenase [Paracoccus denitrificans]MCU7428653.1 GMC family oxidoreductase N-terminal domain-containing protein [Paracoccus denitrificans]QAR26387.1 GMC family oxidoreductase [Paracoccus denitrificans]UPV95315.1 GMC family oxidoreductase N-terminal domain-containing protein [Paracoccus denitrific
MRNDKGGAIERLERAFIAGRISRRTFICSVLATGLVAAGAVGALADELEAIRQIQAERLADLPQRFDYIVVGSGSAGCALVGTLADRTDGNILLIEAGDWDTAPTIDDPRAWFANLGTERDWGDVALPGPGVNGRAIPEHTGRVVGGGSSINATIWARPTRADMDHWAEASGDEAWNYQASREIYKRMENWRGALNPEFRGTDGPVWVQPAQDVLPLVDATLAAVAEIGLPVVDDLNAERELTGNGFGLMNQIIKDGRRHSLARAFLYPVLGRGNVTLLVNTSVNHVLIEGDTAVGVECLRDGQVQTFHADREIILSAGGFNTPKLLMLSGIGDEAHLADHGIDTRMHAPEVGRNVQDHILHGGCIFEAPEPVEHRNSAANISGYLKTDSALDHPDVSIVQIELPYASEVIGQEYAPPAGAWALCGGLVAPQSRGTVRLASADPAARPVIDMQFLSHPEDVEYLARAIRLAREIAHAPALKDHMLREVAPGRDLQGDELANFIRNGATTYFHAAGACRMGRDEGAVVDAQLRVNGIRHLRIADSTIMPRIVTVPTMPVCALIGVRMADMLA